MSNESEAATALLAFSKVSDLETPLDEISDLVMGICLITETMDEAAGPVVHRMALLALERCDAVNELREELFRLTHPNREHFEKTGWPL